MKKILLASALALSCVGFGVAQAQAPTGDSVAIRKAMMRMQGGVLAGLNATAQSKADPKGFANAAGALSASAAQLVGMFPPGSTANSRALPVIWSDAAGFAKAATEFGAAAELALVAAAASDATAFAAAVKVIGDNCNSCHQTFRAR